MTCTLPVWKAVTALEYGQLVWGLHGHTIKIW